MSKRNLLSVVTATILVGVAGGCGGVKDLRKNISPPLENVMVQGAEEKGCLSCHNGIETINDRMQPFLLSFAKVKYGKGRE